jgi:cellulose synthase/poly-beta-1,6-N-acetylglucosamine synthase-like glycosyltransferase
MIPSPIQALKIIVTISFVIFMGFYLAYVTLCVVVIKKNRKKPACYRNEYCPTVSLIIPVHNEASILPPKFKNLEQLNYPKANLEVVFVDGGSDDASAEIIAAYIKENRLQVSLVKEGRRRGFNNAVIEGLKNSTGEIICIPGAETEYRSDALQILVNRFGDQRIGAVSGRMEIKNTIGFSSRLEAAYRRLYNLLREAESYVDSPFDVKGEISAVRRNICEHILNKKSVAQRGNIDCCFVFQSKEDGCRGTYEPNAVYAETVPSSVEESLRQQTRRAATLIENLLLYKNLLFNRRAGYFGTLIMPAHLVMLTILPTFFVVLILGMIALVFLQPFNLLYVSILVVGVLLLLTSSYAQSFVKVQVSMFMAAIGLLFGLETQKFARLSSARETSASDSPSGLPAPRS